MATRIGRKLSVNSSQENGTDTERWLPEQGGIYLLILVKRMGQTQRMATRTGRKQFVDSSQENGTDTERWLQEQGGIHLLILVKRMGQTQSDGYRNKEESIC